jgi:hypothetical protein
LGAISALGERKLYRSVAPLFPDQPVLISKDRFNDDRQGSTT